MQAELMEANSAATIVQAQLDANHKKLDDSNAKLGEFFTIEWFLFRCHPYHGVKGGCVGIVCCRAGNAR